MVRNNPINPFQRRNLIDRQSSCIVQARLVGIVHGLMNPESNPATLLVLEFRFSSLKLNRRIKSANVLLQLIGQSDGDDPEVMEIAPKGNFTFTRTASFQEPTAHHAGLAATGISAGVEATIGYSAGVEATLETAIAMLYGSKLLRGRDWGPYNAVSWDMIEKSSLRSGIPSYLRTAILLKRSNDKIFSFGMNIKTDVSGFSFRSLQDGLLESDDDPIIFDPGASPLWTEDLPHLGGFDLANLGSVDLSSFLEVKLEVLTSENIQQIEMTEHEIMEGLEAFVQPSQVEESSSESWFVNLWDTDPGPDKWESLPPSLERKDLEKYFSWITETPDVRPATPSEGTQIPEQQPQQQSGSSHFCNLIARRSTKNGLTTFNQLADLLSQPPVNALSDFFDLPDDFLLSRHHDRGSCQVFNSRDGSKVLKEYIIQTPFYSSGFWSLLLYSVTDSEIPGSMSKLSGVIQADNDVELPRIFRDVHRLVDRHGHHEMLLPLQLFKTHYETTSKSFKSILDDVAEVDKELLQQLEAEDKQNEVSGLYNKLSMTLHKCSMQLAELSRRRKFEDDLGTRLQKDLQNDRKLEVVLNLYSSMSKSQDSDIEGLPGKIESQRNVLYNLIAQHDSFLQAKLARESLRDSKAMKTLSILTILFLPGAFVATVFSTNMFDFKNNTQQIWIYFTIVVPLTVTLMVGWVLWLRNTPDRTDEEMGRQLRRGMTMDLLKGKKD